MHHAPLDRPRPHDRHLDDEVVELARAHPRQEGELRPALHLEDADGVRPAEHVVDRRILLRQAVEAEPDAAMVGEEVERLADAGQHPEREDVHLEDAERVDVVLVPADDGAVLHRRVLDRHQLVEPPLGDDEAAHVLAEVPGEAVDLLDELHRLRQPPLVGVEAELDQPLARDAAGPPAPDLAGKRRHRVAREAHGRAHLADRPLAAVVDHRGADARRARGRSGGRCTGSPPRAARARSRRRCRAARRGRRRRSARRPCCRSRATSR